MGSSDEEIKFPVICYYKIIAERSDDIKLRIETALKKAGVMNPVKVSHESSRRRYVAFDLELLVHSKDYMNEIDGLLRAVEGVKMVL